MNSIENTIAFALNSHIPTNPKAIQRLALDLSILFPNANVNVIVDALHTEIKRRSTSS